MISNNFRKTRKCSKTGKDLNDRDPSKSDPYKIILSDKYQKEIHPITIAINISLYYKYKNKYTNIATIKSIREMMLRLILYPDRFLEFTKGMKKASSLTRRLKILESYKVVETKTGFGSNTEPRKTSIGLHPDFDRNKLLKVPD